MTYFTSPTLAMDGNPNSPFRWLFHLKQHNMMFQHPNPRLWNNFHFLGCYCYLNELNFLAPGFL